MAALPSVIGVGSAPDQAMPSACARRSHTSTGSDRRVASPARGRRNRRRGRGGAPRGRGPAAGGGEGGVFFPPPPSDRGAATPGALGGGGGGENAPPPAARRRRSLPLLGEHVRADVDEPVAGQADRLDV